jgi:hypothetical protein
MTKNPDWIIHRGGCHCQRVRFEVEAPAELELYECNGAYMEVSDPSGVAQRAAGRPDAL